MVKARLSPTFVFLKLLVFRQNRRWPQFQSGCNETATRHSFAASIAEMTEWMVEIEEKRILIWVLQRL